MRKRGSLTALLWACVPSCFLASFFLLPVEPAPLVLSEADGPTLTIAFVGDVMLGRGVAQALDGDWEAAFVEVQPWLAEADGSAEFAEVLAFANLESPLTTAPFSPFIPPTGGDSPPSSSLMSGTASLSSPQLGGRYDLRAPPEAVAALQTAGFDVVSLANNHALDAGQAGLAETRRVLQEAAIIPVGQPTFASTSTSFTHPSSTHPSSTLSCLAFDDSVMPLDLEAAAEVVATAAEQSDMIIVSIHWGGEYQAAPGPRQRAIARALAEAGAGIIVGHGPHVLQRVEWVGEALVAYSLGNFLFDQPYPADCRWGAILRVTLQGGRIVAVRAVPTVVEQGRVRPAGLEDGAAILARLALEPSLQPPVSSVEEHKP